MRHLDDMSAVQHVRFALSSLFANRMNSDVAVKALAALAQPTRLSVFRLLVQAGGDGLHAGRIAQALALPSATLSFHLKELAHAGLVEGQQEGKFVVYRAKYDQMNALVGFLSEHCCEGGDGLCDIHPPVCAPVPSSERKVASVPKKAVTTRRRALVR